MVGKIRRLLHCLAAGAFYYSGMLRLRSFCKRRMLCQREIYILGFHRILGDEELRRSNSQASIVLREETFVKMLEHISRHYQTIPLDTLAEDPGGRANLSKPLCLLTFDDGWKDNYTTAFPWLKRLGVPAIIFLSVGPVASRETFWVERLMEALKDPSRREQVRSRVRCFLPAGQPLNGSETIVEFLKHMPAEKRQEILGLVLSPQESCKQEDTVDQLMSWDQVIEMSRYGIEFGSHTVTHPLLNYESDATVGEEVRLSKQILEETLGRQVRAFAYPNGDHNDRVRQQVKEALYEWAFTASAGQYHGKQDEFMIPRILLHNGNVTGPRGKFSPAMFSFTLARSQGWS